MSQKNPELYSDQFPCISNFLRLVSYVKLCKHAIFKLYALEANRKWVSKHLEQIHKV